MDLFTYTKTDALFEPSFIVGMTWISAEEPHGSVMVAEDTSEEPFDVQVVGADGVSAKLVKVSIPGGAKAGQIRPFFAEAMV